MEPPLRLKVRPMSELEDLKTIMEMCWDEIPETRPEFSEIKKLLRKLNKGRYERQRFIKVTWCTEYGTSLPRSYS